MADDFELADSVSGESLVEFLDSVLAAEETNRPPDYDAEIAAILQNAYIRPDGWSAVKVLDQFDREIELAAPTLDQLYGSIERFHNLR